MLTPRGGLGEVLPQFFIIKSSRIPGQMQRVAKMNTQLTAKMILIC
jgi:hypothetical protein